MEHSPMTPTIFSKYLDDLAPRGRTMLLPALIEAQKHFGQISKETATTIGRVLNVPLADITGVIEFYSMLYTEPTGETIIRVCTSPTCSARGGRRLLQETLTELGQEKGKASVDGKYFVEAVECLGLCDQAPSALVDEVAVGQSDVAKLLNPADDFKTEIYGEERVLTKRCGVVAPTSLEDYLAQQGFAGFRNALKKDMDRTLNAIKASGLLGRGGAAFPTGVKGAGAAEATGSPKYIVCNADESEPGTFKDRVLLEEDPFAILEGMLIAGYVIGAEKGLMYIRGEYFKAQHIFQAVIDNARAHGYLGENVLGSGFSFDIEIRSGAGAYICGEETALFESIEGKRGFPRLKPPFPTTHGLFQQPTAINNVETFANVTLIMEIGVEKYRSFGSADSPGPRLFCLSGDIEKPGLYEVLYPLPLDVLVHEQAGGVSDGQELQAILLGGAAGKFVPSDKLNICLTHEDTRAAGLSLGSASVVVFSESANLKQTFVDLGHFFAHESCGKCYPCQLGTQRQAEILNRNLAGELIAGDFERLEDVGWTMTDASLCGLGQTAAAAILSAMENWPELFNEAGVS